MGANSLLDIVVFGRACALHIAENLTPGKPHKVIREDAGMDSIKSLDEIRTSSGSRMTSEIRLDMQKAMQVRFHRRFSDQLELDYERSQMIIN